MKTKQFDAKVYTVIGFMLFALFFGAANLIYPALLGIYSGKNVWVSILAFCLTGVTLPFLGVIATAWSGAKNMEELASRVSKPYAIFFSVALYLSIGPFFAIPRTGATSYSMGVEPIFGSSLVVKVIYALIFFGLSYWMAIKPSKMTERIGKYLTPTLLITIAVVIIMSFINPSGSLGAAHNASSSVNDAFKDLPFIAGLIQGYGTMDALASLAFAVLVIDAAKQYGATSEKEISGLTIKSGLVAISLLALIYIFVARIGATSQGLFDFSNGQFVQNGIPIDGGHVLSQASKLYLGTIGQNILSIIVFLACLTTSTGLITACAEYFHGLIPKISHVMWASIFTLIATTFYFGGLSEIIKWSVPVLYLLYPLTITLIILVLGDKYFHSHRSVYVFTIGLTFFAGLYDAISTFATMTGFFTISSALSNFFTKVVPLGQYSLGWVTFALIGLILGLVFSKVKK